MAGSLRNYLAGPVNLDFRVTPSYRWRFPDVVGGWARGRPDTKIAKPGPRGVSGGAGGAAVRLDAVLAEQVAQAIELTVHPLVLRDDVPDVYPGCPLVLQPQFLGAQLLFPCAQRRGAVEVTRLERVGLLPLHLAELLGGVRKA